MPTCLTRRSTWAWPIAALAWLGATTGCGSDRAAHAGDSAPARRLVGDWYARFRGSVMPPRGSAGATADVSGVLALLPNHRLENVLGLDVPTNVGTFDVDFTPLGFEARDPGRAPVAVARTFGRDSVALALGTGGAEPTLRMRGAWAGDSVLGRWTVTVGRTSGGEGSFVLTRHP